MDFHANGMGEEKQSFVLDSEFEMVIWLPGDALWATEGKTQIPQDLEHKVSE